MLYLSILYASVIKCILGYATRTCIVCYICRYTSTCIMYNTPQVIKCTPLLSWLFYSYAKLQCYISTCIFIIHFRSSKVHHSYPGYSIAMLCYVTVLHVYLYHTLQVIKYTPPLSWLCWVRSAPPPPLPSFMSGRRSFILRWSGMSEWAPVPRVPV